MAGNLHVRNLDDDLIARLKRRAARHGRSAEAEHREILRQALANEEEAPFEKLAAAQKSTALASTGIWPTIRWTILPRLSSQGYRGSCQDTTSKRTRQAQRILSDVLS